MPPPSTARVVRRAPLLDRIRANLNPAELFLWVSEEVNSHDWEEFDRQWSTALGVGLNLLFVLARISSAAKSNGDDIFEDYSRGDERSVFLDGVARFLVQILTLFSVVNALFTLFRTKQYRLFHSDVNASISTPSARRVKVDSSSAASSPLRFLSGVIAPATDGGLKDEDAPTVWELSVWDPLPVCLRLFVLFSPGHVLIVRLFLPYTPHDPRPSVTVTQTLLLCALLSIQGHFLQKRFSQQSKDTTKIHGEVSKEYDHKFVQPNAHRNPVRDVGTQAPHSRPIWDDNQGEWTAVPEVVSGRPYVSPRGFRTMPSAAYVTQRYDAHDHHGMGMPAGEAASRYKTPDILSPPHAPSSSWANDPSSPIRSPSARPFQTSKRGGVQYSNASTSAAMGVGPAATASASAPTGDGGSLGVYTHAASPLRKAASANLLRHHAGPANEVRRREGSPLKRTSTPAGGLHQRFARD